MLNMFSTKYICYLALERTMFLVGSRRFASKPHISIDLGLEGFEAMLPNGREEA